jgi:hypothetical protein
LEAATTRMSTRTVSELPNRWNSRSCGTRSSLTCGRRLRLPEIAYFSTLRLSVTEKTPATPLAWSFAMFLSPTCATMPSSVT